MRTRKYWLPEKVLSGKAQREIKIFTSSAAVACYWVQIIPSLTSSLAYNAVSPHKTSRYDEGKNVRRTF